MKKPSFVAAVSLCVNVIFAGLLFSAYTLQANEHPLQKAPAKKVAKAKTYPDPAYNEIADDLASEPPTPHAIVFLGDSLTAREQWHELFQNPRVINRGISGDTTWGMLERLKPILSMQPDKIFIMGGINDLQYGGKVSQTVKNMKMIIDEIKYESPNTTIYLQSVLPTRDSMHFSVVKPDQILSIDAQLQKLAAQERVTYINLYPLFAVNQQMNPKLTMDGIHLLGNGYAIWSSAIKKYVNRPIAPP